MSKERDLVLKAARRAGYDLILDEDYSGRHMHEQILQDLIRFARFYEVEKALVESGLFDEEE